MTLRSKGTQENRYYFMTRMGMDDKKRVIQITPNSFTMPEDGATVGTTAFEHDPRPPQANIFCETT